MSYREYYEFLWDGIEGRAVAARTDDTGAPVDQKFFVWPDQAEDLYAFTEANADRDLYTSVSLFRANRAKKGVVGATTCVHGDADTFNVADARLEPSMIVHTSEGKTHLYWKIIDSTDPHQIEELAHGVSAAHPKDATGFDDGWAINKLLRVPGTTNTGYSNPKSKKYVRGADANEVTVEFTGAEYTLEEFAEAYPPVAELVLEDKNLPDALPSLAEALNSITSSTVLLDLLDHGHSRQNLDRSDALFLLENECFRLGATDEATFVICQSSKVNKFQQDGKANADELLWKDVLRARAKVGVSEVYEDDDDDVVVTVQPQKKDAAIDFLTAEEKDNLRPTFISEYLAWASSKTDAAHDYHIASAFTVLSTVFSDYGHAVPKWGKTNLNLWFMVLGETTRSRKSTARGQMLKFISALSDDDLYTYDLGSDFTPEALDNALLERPNRSALVHRDEFQGFLREMDQKAYLAGAKQKLTEIYDGHVSGKLRATGENKRRASVETSLVLFAMGIRDQVAASMTQEDFQSGFLTRFIYVEAPAPKRTRSNDWVPQADITEVKEGDKVFEALVHQLDVARSHWDSFVPADGPTTPVPCTPEAWERLWKFSSDVLDAAEGQHRHAIIEASSQRLTTSILKAATLLAMYECCDEVELSHMLAAINYCSTWFLHMVSMANRVSESVWERKQEEVIEYIMARGGTAYQDTTYAKFRKELRTREFLEILDALKQAGVLQTAINETNKRAVLTVLDPAA